MSVPKNFLDLMRTVGIPTGKTPFLADSGIVPDDDWTKLTVGEAVNVVIESDPIANKDMLLAAESGVSPTSAFVLKVAAGPLPLPYPLAAGSYLYVRASSTASGGSVRIWGFRPDPGTLAT